jgi:hypothetical protein
MAICKLEQLNDLIAFFGNDPSNNQYVVCEAGVGDIEVQLEYQDKILVRTNLGSGGVYEDVKYYLQIRNIESKLPSGNITVYGRCRFIPNFRYQVTANLVFTDFTIDQGFVELYTDRLHLLKSWGFNVPQYIVAKQARLLDTVQDSLRVFDHNRSSGIFIVENAQNTVAPEMAYMSYAALREQITHFNGDIGHESLASAGAVHH